MKRIAFLLMGVLFVAGSLQAKLSLASLEEKVARSPDNARAVYKLARRYCEDDSAVQAIETWKRLADLDLKLASDVFLRTKVAVYLGLEPFFPQPVSDSIAMTPRFSPDGRKIVFHSMKNGQIGSMDFSGENFRWITADDRYNATPCFGGSRDQFFYIRSTADDTGMELVYYNAEGGEPEVLLSGLSSLCETPDWVSNDLPVLFFYLSVDTKSGEIALYDRKTGELIELTHDAYMDRFPRYSSNGKLIVYADYRRLQPDIYIMNSRGKLVERVTDWPGRDIYPDFGDHNRKIAFVSDRNGGGQFDVFVCDRRTGEVIPVTYNERTDTTPDLSNDGNWLLFQSNRGDGRPRTYIVSLNQPISAEQLLAEIETKEE
ncbi:PD40 domain-containing protein [candidate division WOR-3 bacterium]|nr:PD40 domain-containing protein [candidate division WOR-3 bacterium]